MTVAGKHTQRFMELEGVRGIAAVAVVISHFVLAFYPGLITGNGAVAHTRFEDNIHGTPLALLYAGTFAVAIFFVLSGFVLSIGFFQTKDTKIVKKMAASRYLRLMIPALASVLLAYFLMSLGFARIPEMVGVVAGSTGWIDSWSFDTSFLAAVKSGAIDIFVQTGSGFNNVLWTMHTEFIGSFLIFIFLLLFAQSKYRWVIYIGLIVLTFNTWFMPFMLGLILADAYAHGKLENLKRIWIILPLLAGGLLLGSIPHGEIKGTAYEFLIKFDLSAITGVSKVSMEMFYLSIGATMLILAVLLSARLRQWLGHQRVAILGKYTFSLYLTHLMVLYVIACPLFLALHETLGYNKTVLLVMLLCIPLLWIVARMFERYVDAPAIRLAKYAGAVYTGDVVVDWRKHRLAAKRKIRKFRQRFSTGSSSAPELEAE